MAEIEIIAAMVPSSKKTAAPLPAAATSALSNYMDSLVKEMGPEVVHLVTEESVAAIPVIGTGVPALDLSLGCGGIPRGRVTEIYGPEMSGKTTLALQIAAQAQKEPDAFVHFVDAEHALDLQYAQNLGVDLSRLPISQPNSGEQALNLVEHACTHGVSLVIVDSVAALVPQSELDGEMGDSQMGVQARLMSQAMRKLEGIASKNNTTIIFINQIRMKIGVVYGNPETTSGGNALKYAASIRIDIRKGAPLKGDEKDEPYGQVTRVKIVKNKCAPPFRSCEFDLIYGQGFDTVKSLIDVATDRGVMEKSGAWIKYKDEKWHGLDNAKDDLIKRPDILKEIAEAL